VEDILCQALFAVSRVCFTCFSGLPFLYRLLMSGQAGWEKLVRMNPTDAASNGSGTATTDRDACPPQPSLAHLKRRISEEKWKEAHQWPLARTKTRKFDTPRLKKATNPTPTNAPKRIASRFYQLKSGHALTATHMKQIKKNGRSVLVVLPVNADPGALSTVNSSIRPSYGSDGTGRLRAVCPTSLGGTGQSAEARSGLD